MVEDVEGVEGVEGVDGVEGVEEVEGVEGVEGVEEAKIGSTGLGMTKIFWGSQFVYSRISCLDFSEMVVMYFAFLTGRSRKIHFNKLRRRPL